MEATQGVPTREQIALEDTWNKESVYSGADAWESEFDAVAKQLPSLETFSGKLSQDPEALASWFEDSSKLMRRVMKLYFYAFMSISVNSDDETAKAMVGRITGLYAQFAAKTAFA